MRFSYRASGIIEFSNLKLGSYVIVETSPLDRYVMMNTPIQLNVTYNDIRTVTVENRKSKAD